MNDTSLHVPWYKRIGPGLITACVVIGPGSITTSSSVGASSGYSQIWIVVVSVIFMLTYMVLGAKLGVVADASPCDLIRRKSGSGLAILVGCCVFFISAAFQSGNNIGVAAAFEAFINEDNVSDPSLIVSILLIIFNAIAISFLYAFKDMYKMLERAMMTFVALMLLSFAVNLIMLKPDVGAMAAGFVPSTANFDITVLGLVGTTFVITAAFYQSYLVRQKGWDEAQLRNGLIDARIGSMIMALITIMLMSTAAAALYQGGTPVKFSSPVDIAEGLNKTFGPSAKIIFCLGLFSAAYSSFIVNSMIGGFILADGLGLGSKPTDLWPRLFTTLALLTGMAIGIATIYFKFDRAPTIIAAQAVTVVGAPLVAGVLFWLTSQKDVMGSHTNKPLLSTLAGIGLALLLAMAGNTAMKLYDQLLRAPTAQPTAAMNDFQLSC